MGGKKAIKLSLNLLTYTGVLFRPIVTALNLINVLFVTPDEHMYEYVMMIYNPICFEILVAVCSYILVDITIISIFIFFKCFYVQKFEFCQTT